jgi:hypothetical protein
MLIQRLANHTIITMKAETRQAVFRNFRSGSYFTVTQHDNEHILTGILQLTRAFFVKSNN